MAQQIINVGTAPNDGTGDTLKSSFTKTNANFTELYSRPAASVTISDTPPGSPIAGSVWWESDTGKLWIYYTDANTSQWVVVASGGVSAVQPGALVLIQRQDVSSPVSSVDFTSGIDATYDEYELHVIGFLPASTSGLALRVSLDGGATYKAGATDYAYNFRIQAAVTANSSNSGSEAGSTVMVLCPAVFNAVAPADGIIRFTRPSDTTRRKHFRSEFAGSHQTAGFFSSTGAGILQTTDFSAINAIRVMCSVGTGTNITAGTFIFYGVKK